MKICWDNLENVVLTKNSKFRDKIKGKSYYYKEICKNCKESFLTISKDGKFCCMSCRSIFNSKNEKNPNYGKKHTKKTKEKISKTLKHYFKENYNSIEKLRILATGRKHTEETKQKIGKKSKGRKHTEKSINKMKLKCKRGKEHYNWKGGVKKKKLPLYNTYAPQIEIYEEIRKTHVKKIEILEIRCIYCGRWYIPKRRDVYNRIKCIKGEYEGESRLYCSTNCKKSCTIYGKTPEQLMKEDAIRAGRLEWHDLNREVQSELRKMVLERDNYQCIKCNSEGPLYCHHIFPVATDPLLSADIDNCITLCKECHKKVHKLSSCGYNELKC